MLNPVPRNDFTHVVSSLCRKYQKAQVGLDESKSHFEELSAAAPPAALAKWKLQEAAALEARLHDVKAMDIFEVSTDKGMSKTTGHPHT